ncbi:LysR substrate-binding domain-containing protein [Marinomonas communis]|nr:LysR substrate-binding domain-containing protein [Marinomonas communis]
MRSKIYRSLPSLVTIQAFVVCSELKSINKASLMLNRSQGAVSKQIQQLEEFYGVVLFERLTSGLELTVEGRRFLGVAYELLEVVGKFESSNEQLTELTIYSPSTFALRWLLPRIERIKKAVPEIKVHVRSTHSDVTNFDENTPSLAVVRGEPSASNVVSMELLPELLTPMCSPYILDLIREKEWSLEGQNLLHASPVGEEWHAWLDQNRSRKVDGTQAIYFDTLDVAMSAAESSLGVVIGDPTMAKERLESGRLVMPYRSVVPSGQKYFLCYLERFNSNKEIQKLIRAVERSL